MLKKNAAKLRKKNAKNTPAILQENKPKEFFILQAHLRFDEIESVLTSKCYQTEQVKKAREFLSLARHFAVKACSEDSVQSWMPG